MYRIENSIFKRNTANSDGGGCKTSSSGYDNGLFSYNAQKNSISLKSCVFNRNKLDFLFRQALLFFAYVSRATNYGGGLLSSGVGLEIVDITFFNNDAISSGTDDSAGAGGGLAAVDGASVSLLNANFAENIASHQGGAAFISDSSVRVSRSNFTANVVRMSEGNGGAIGLRLSTHRLLPTIEIEDEFESRLFESINCCFIGNKAPALGGAIYHHQQNPAENYTVTWNCDSATARRLKRLHRDQDEDLTCEWINNIRKRLEDRVVRLHNTIFRENTATNGAALFTNHHTAVNPEKRELQSDRISFVGSAVASSLIDGKSVEFVNNSITNEGYGPSYATLPATVTVSSAKGIPDGNSFKIPEFRSGGRLEFNVSFYDAFGQKVTSLENFTAVLEPLDAAKNGPPLEISGQTVSRIESNGNMLFSGTKLQGVGKVEYLLKLRFVLEGEEVLTRSPTVIKVCTRECRIGERTKSDGKVIECLPCGPGQFNAYPRHAQCKSCEITVEGKCYGQVALPNERYWHFSSISVKMLRCIGQESCVFANRLQIINETEFEAHLNNTPLLYTNESSLQCKEGYKGILCGSCQTDYGRVGLQCQKCAPKRVLYVGIALLMFWSIIFIAYFMRSSLDLAKRVSLNEQVIQDLAKHLAEPILEEPDAKEKSVNVSSSKPLWSNQNNNDEGQNQSESGPSSIPPLRSSPACSTDAANVDHKKAKQLARAISIVRMEQVETDNKTAIQASGINTAPGQSLLAKKLIIAVNRHDSERQDVLPLANSVSEVLKILINFLQITGLAVSINVDWADGVRQVLYLCGAAGDVATETGYLSLDCILNASGMHRSLKRMTVTILYPVLLFCVFVTYRLVLVLLHRKPKRSSGKKKDPKTCEKENPQDSGQPDLENGQETSPQSSHPSNSETEQNNAQLQQIEEDEAEDVDESRNKDVEKDYSESEPNQNKSLKKHIRVTVICVTYVFYIGLTRNLLRFFACVKIDHDDEVYDRRDTVLPFEHSYWEEDTAVRCYSGMHGLLVSVMVLPLLVMVSIGFPLVSLFVLYRNRHRLEDPKIVSVYGFLYRAYKYYYWEIVVIIRKALIAAIVVFAHLLGENIQSLLCIFVLAIALTLHTLVMPFKKDLYRLNYAESLSISASIIVLLAGLLFNDSYLTTMPEVLITVITNLIISGTILYIICELGPALQEYVDAKLLESGKMCIVLSDATFFDKMNIVIMDYLRKALNYLREALHYLRGFMEWFRKIQEHTGKENRVPKTHSG